MLICWFMQGQIRKPNIIQPGHFQTNSQNDGILPLSFMVNSCNASFAGQKNGEIVHLLRRKMCPGARKQNVSNFFSSGSFAVGKRRTWRIRFLVLATWILRLWLWIGSWKPLLSTYQWVKYPNFTESQPFLICSKRKYQPQTEGICYLTKLLGDVMWRLHPLKQSNVLHRKLDKNIPGSKSDHARSKSLRLGFALKKHVFCASKQNMEVVWSSWCTAWTQICIYVQCIHRKIIDWINFFEQ